MSETLTGRLVEKNAALWKAGSLPLAPIGRWLARKSIRRAVFVSDDIDSALIEGRTVTCLGGDAEASGTTLAAAMWAPALVCVGAVAIIAWFGWLAGPTTQPLAAQTLSLAAMLLSLLVGMRTAIEVSEYEFEPMEP